MSEVRRATRSPIPDLPASLDDKLEACDRAEAALHGGDIVTALATVVGLAIANIATRERSIDDVRERVRRAGRLVRSQRRGAWPTIVKR